jgi:hypothetical protein
MHFDVTEARIGHSALPTRVDAYTRLYLPRQLAIIFQEIHERRIIDQQETGHSVILFESPEPPLRSM